MENVNLKEIKDQNSMVEFAELIAQSVVDVLEKRELISKKPDKSNNSVLTAYKKTEQLLYNYNGFKNIVEERLQEIEDIKKYGVPQSCGTVGERVQTSRTVQGIVLEEESVENAVQKIHCAIQGTVQVIALIDKCMKALEKDPYYKVLEMRYFEGRTLEEIGVLFKCDSSTISRNRNRLVKELSLRLFPDDVINEMMG